VIPFLYYSFETQLTDYFLYIIDNLSIHIL